MIRQYETTFIIDAHLSTEDIEQNISKTAGIIEKNKGKIELIDRWGKRRLAYEIGKKQYGYYVYIRFEAEGTVVEALEKDFKLDDNILRYLVLRVPKVVINEELRKKEARSKSEEESDASGPEDTPPKKKKEEEPEAEETSGAEEASSSNETDETEESEKPDSSES